MKCKLFVAVISCAVILSQLATSAFAASTETDKIKKFLDKSMVSASEQQILKKKLNQNIDTSTFANTLGTDNSIKSYTLSEARKIYDLQDLMLTAYSPEKGMKALYEGSFIQVPVKSGDRSDGAAKFCGNNDELLGSVIYKNSDEQLPNNDELVALIDKNVNQVTDVSFAHSYRYYTTFAVIESKTGEYLIPYSTAQDKIGLINGKVYTSKQAIDVMSSIYDESAAIKEGNLNGGTPLRNYWPKIILWCVIFIIFFGITLTVIILYIRAKRKNRHAGSN